MKIHVVHAHPATDSFGAALHARLVATLQQRGDELRDVDLYQLGFDPVLRADEWRGQEDPTQVPDELRPYVEALQWAEACVFCFPTWWSGMPAILKGYFDRVWRPGIAFDRPEGATLIRPALHNIRRFGVITTYGSPVWYNRIFMQDPARKMLKRGLAGMCGPGVKQLYLAMPAIDSSTQVQRERFADTVERRFAAF